LEFSATPVTVTGIFTSENKTFSGLN